MNKVFRYAAFSRPGPADQPVCCNPATLYPTHRQKKPQKNPHKNLKDGKLTDILHVPFDGQSVVVFLDRVSLVSEAQQS